MTTRTFRPYEPDDLWLLPPSPQDWLPEDHLAYFLADLVEVLDLEPILATYGGVTRGTAPYHPQLLVKVLLYAYTVGIPASRQIARKLEEDVAFRVLAANQRPDFRTLSDFRKQHLPALANLFVQVLKLCQRAGLVKLGHIALDGTKVKANASKHKAMSYGRMGTEEARLTAEVQRLLTQAEAADARDDAAYGPDRRGDELPAELARRKQRWRPFGPPRRCWSRRPKPRPLSSGWLTRLARQQAPVAAGRHSRLARGRTQRRSAISPTRRAGSCRMPERRGVSFRAITVKPPWMPPPRSLSPPTSPMSRMTSSKPNRC
jgi:transposase